MTFLRRKRARGLPGRKPRRADARWGYWKVGQTTIEYLLTTMAILILFTSMYSFLQGQTRKLFSQAGLDLMLYSNVPPGSGLGSSSTMMVTLVALVAAFHGLPLTTYELAELAHHLDLIDDALRKALGVSRLPEQSGRLRQLLDAPLTLAGPERIRRWRALLVLEQIASPEAKALLERIATGPTGAIETDAAKSALRRLEKR